MTNDMCKVLHSSVDRPKIVDGSLCTSTYYATLGLCSGDSGGPLVYANSLVGVISWGVPCALGKPDVYTRVSTHLGWIASVIG